VAAGQPLVGRTVVVTRASEQASVLAAALADAGATVVELPATMIVDTPDGMTQLIAALEQTGRFAWLVVTSPNGASRLARALGGRSPRPARVAAVGPGTADALAAAGLPCDLVPRDAIAEGLLDALAVAPDADDRAVLVAQAAAARPVLVEGLAARGWVVTAIPVYEAVPRPAEADGVERLRGADAVVFAAGSAVRAVVGAYGTAALPPVVVSMGPVTSAAARDAGLAVAAEADPHTIGGLVAATVRALAG
jgi:uroporphyrinogen-III synthase